MTSSGPASPSRDLDAGRAPEVGLPVRLQLDDGADDDAAREGPVDIVGVEPVDDVPDAHGLTRAEARHEMDDPKLRERVARLSHGRWLEVGAWQVGDVVKGQHPGPCGAGG